MNNILLLFVFITCFGLFLIKYSLGHNIIIDPGSGILIFFSVSIACALIGNVRWDNTISFEYCGIVIMLLLSIMLGSLVGNKCVVNKGGNISVSSNNLFVNKRIDVRRSKKYIVIGLCCILTALYAMDIIKAGKSLGATGLSIISAIRGAKDVSTNFIIRQGIKFVMAAAFVNNYIFAFNVINKRKKSDILFLVPMICGCACSIFTGVRTEIFRLMISLFVDFSIVIYEKRRWKNNGKSFHVLLKKTGVPVIAFVIAFFALRNVMKGTTYSLSENNFNIFNYILFYVGGPWIVLNNKMTIGLDKFKGILFGENTFSSLYTDLIDFGLLNKPGGLKATTYITVDPISGAAGNVDTLFGNPLVDFGTFGAILFLFTLSVFFACYYRNYIYGSYSSYSRNRRVIVYSFLFYMIALSFYSNVFTYYISVYFVLTYILIRLVYWFYFRVKV